ncbi:MAG: hypothetical protein WB660_04355, partial [Candidatus Sulfotelmatobacter sp.]
MMSNETIPGATLRGGGQQSRAAPGGGDPLLPSFFTPYAFEWLNPVLCELSYERACEQARLSRVSS